MNRKHEKQEKPDKSGPGTAFAEAGELSRRSLLCRLGGVALAASASALGSGTEGAAQEAAPDLEETLGLATADRRQADAFRIRLRAAQNELALPIPAHPTNGDEQRYLNRIGSFHKSLPHDSQGEVETGAYRQLLRAVESGRPEDFEAVPLGGPTKLINPQAGLAFDLEGSDGHALAIPPAPALASAQEAGEMVELYWAALLRDVQFADFSAHPEVAAACADLNTLQDFRGPRRGGRITPATLFRDSLPGATQGPYISQFLLLPTPLGAEFIERHMRTYLPGTDHLTSFDDWLQVQNGGPPAGSETFDPQRRYIRTPRDLAAWVHRDVVFQAYFGACSLLITPPNTQEAESSGLGCPLNPGNPYLRSSTQTGFGTFGAPGIEGLVTEVASRALKCTWHQKWFVHRRLRPEECGGLVHLEKVSGRYPGILHQDLLGSAALDRVFDRFGSFLHPQSFPEGCPTHPSYSAGHATVAGACVTILKALFDETFVIENPVVPSADGLTLLPYQGGAALTVGGELNKLASNIGTGRNLAGVHWRSDAVESLRLGETIALSILRDQRATYNESRDGFFEGYTFTRFDGSRVTV